MSRKDELKAELSRFAGGSPADLSRSLDCEPSDATFRRALGELVDEGVFESEGEGPSRRYRNTSHQPSVDEQLVAAVPCSAREFSDAGHRLGLFGRELGRRKLALGIETCKDPTGATTRWFCRLKEA